LVKSLAGQTVTFEEGDQVTFNIAVTNEGDLLASDIEVVDYIPTGLTFVSSSAPSQVQ
jgi:uncharacterized repeat protein (TIGR01451 family)